MDIKKLIQDLEKGNPELKKLNDESRNWRRNKQEEYMSQGIEERVALTKAWNDYWVMAKEKHGVEFSIRQINKEEL